MTFPATTLTVAPLKRNVRRQSHAISATFFADNGARQHARADHEGDAQSGDGPPRPGLAALGRSLMRELRAVFKTENRVVIYPGSATGASILDGFDMSLGTGLNKVADRVLRIGRLEDFDDLRLIGTLCGVEMGLMRAGVAHEKGGARAAMEFLTENAS